MTAAPIDQLAAALDGAEPIIAAVGPDEWELPTPCSEWTVRDVVNHLVGGNLLFTRVLGGEPLPPREELIAASRADRLGDDPVGAFRDSAAAVLAAFGSDGALTRTVTVPAGTVPGSAALQLRIVEALVHGWDVAGATGRQAAFPDALVQQALDFTRAQLGRLGTAPAGRGPFAPPQPVADDAPALDRLAALLGRSVAPAEQDRAPAPETSGA
jgi:uncharacterized protein (TIGR03086 family)